MRAVFCFHRQLVFRRWPRARRTRRARRLSLRADTSSSMECGCPPSAGGRWRRSPISPSEAATYGLSPTRSQVNTPGVSLRPVLAGSSLLVLALCCSGAAPSPRGHRSFTLYIRHRATTAQQSTVHNRHRVRSKPSHVSYLVALWWWQSFHTSL